MNCHSNLSRRLKRRRRQVGGRLSCNGRGERGRFAGGCQVRVHIAVYRLPACETLVSHVPKANTEAKIPPEARFLIQLLKRKVVLDSSIAFCVWVVTLEERLSCVDYSPL